MAARISLLSLDVRGLMGADTVRRMRGTLIVVVVVVLGLGCSASGSVPDIDDEAASILQARAFLRACSELICAGSPILAPDSTPPLARAAIIDAFTDEVTYLSSAELAERPVEDGRFVDRAVLLDASDVYRSERNDVAGVDMSMSRWPGDHVQRTYLFLWNGTRWVDTSPEAVSVTVTTAVS